MENGLLSLWIALIQIVIFLLVGLSWYSWTMYCYGFWFAIFACHAFQLMGFRSSLLFIPLKRIAYETHAKSDEASKSLLPP
uniref:Uncharacterized protein n=1 Tax=Arundo donax TaxID=35708 RepID=A0A0A8YIE5_ARUDO